MKGNNKFVLEDYSLPNLENFDTSITIPYSFNLNDYAQKVDGDLFVNLNLNKGWLDFKTKKDRKNPIFLHYSSYTSNQYQLEIPEGYSIEFLPKEVNFKNDYFSFHLKYSVQNNIIYYDHLATANILLIEGDDIAQWEAFIDVLEKAYKQTLILKHDD